MTTLTSGKDKALLNYSNSLKSLNSTQRLYGASYNRFKKESLKQKEHALKMLYFSLDSYYSFSEEPIIRCKHREWSNIPNTLLSEQQVPLYSKISVFDEVLMDYKSHKFFDVVFQKYASQRIVDDINRLYLEVDCKGEISRNTVKFLQRDTSISQYLKAIRKFDRAISIGFRIVYLSLLRNPTAQVRRVNNEDLSQIISEFVKDFLEAIEDEEKTGEMKNQALENLYYLLKFTYKIRVFSKSSSNPLGYNPVEVPFIHKIELSQKILDKFKNETVWRSMLGNAIYYSKNNKQIIEEQVKEEKSDGMLNLMFAAQLDYNEESILNQVYQEDKLKGYSISKLGHKIMACEEISEILIFLKIELPTILDMVDAFIEKEKPSEAISSRLVNQIENQVSWHVSRTHLQNIISKKSEILRASREDKIFKALSLTAPFLLIKDQAQLMLVKKSQVIKIRNGMIYSMLKTEELENNERIYLWKLLLKKVRNLLPKRNTIASSTVSPRTS